MRDTVKAIESTGKRVFTFAPSADASRGVLQSEGFKDADIVEKLLTNQKLHKQLYGNVIWVDEAGLISTPDMKRIFELASEHKARVVLSGDTSQHHAVRRGDALRILQRDAGLRWQS